MATEQPCDVAYEFGDGLLDVDYPDGFPQPGTTQLDLKLHTEDQLPDMNLVHWTAN